MLLLKDQELRLYSFCNFYMSSIQQGIQTGHMSDNMSVKYMSNEGIGFPKGTVAMHRDWIMNGQ